MTTIRRVNNLADRVGSRPVRPWARAGAGRARKFVRSRPASWYKRARFFKHKQTLSGKIDVFNVFNVNAVTLIENLSMRLPGFGNPAQVQLPRRVRLGVRWSF